MLDRSNWSWPLLFGALLEHEPYSPPQVQRLLPLQKHIELSNPGRSPHWQSPHDLQQLRQQLSPRAHSEQGALQSLQQIQQHYWQPVIQGDPWVQAKSRLPDFADRLLGSSLALKVWLYLAVGTASISWKNIAVITLFISLLLSIPANCLKAD